MGKMEKYLSLSHHYLELPAGQPLWLVSYMATNITKQLQYGSRRTTDLRQSQKRKEMQLVQRRKLKKMPCPASLMNESIRSMHFSLLKNYPCNILMNEFRLGQMNV